MHLAKNHQIDTGGVLGVVPKFLANLDPAIYESQNYVVLDFETDTSGGNYGRAVEPANGLLLACWQSGHISGPTISHWGSEYEQDQLLEAVSQADFIVAHNAKYELQWLKRCGADLHKILPFDTRLAEYVLLGNLAAGDEVMPPRSVSLDACVRRRGGHGKDPVVDIMIKHGINPRDIPRAWLEGRCKQDVETTHWLFRKQLEALRASSRLAVQYTRCLLTPVLADIEFNGMHLDGGKVKTALSAHQEQFRILSEQMGALTGGINWRSPKQAGKFIYEDLGFEEIRNKRGEPVRTEGGDPKTDNKTLEKLKAKTAQQHVFIALRKELGKIAAALSKNLEFFDGAVTDTNGVFYAELNQANTATHRLSSNGIRTKFSAYEEPKTVQFQNLPRAFKSLFSPRQPGWLAAEVDGAALEFRVAAYLGNDAQAKLDISTGHDPHKFTASVLNTTTFAAVTDAERQAAKADTFKPLYGGQKGTAAQEAYYKAFRVRYPGIDKAQRSWLSEVLATKRLITPWGLRYYWPYAHVSRSGYVNVTSAVYNYPVQGLATAEIIPIALVYLWHYMSAHEDSMMLVNTVHDSAVAEVAETAAAEFKKIALKAFTTDVYTYLKRVYNIDFDVPLGCGFKIGQYWGEANEDLYNVYQDGRVEKVK